MTFERALRLMAGVIILLSLALAYYFSAIGFHQLVSSDVNFQIYGPQGCRLCFQADQIF